MFLTVLAACSVSAVSGEDALAELGQDDSRSLDDSKPVVDGAAKRAATGAADGEQSSAIKILVAAQVAGCLIGKGE